MTPKEKPTPTKFDLMQQEMAQRELMGRKGSLQPVGL